MVRPEKQADVSEGQIHVRYVVWRSCCSWPFSTLFLLLRVELLSSLCVFYFSYDDGDERTHELISGKYFPFSGPNLPGDKGSGTKKKHEQRQDEATHNMPKLPDVATVQQWQVACVTKPVRRDDGAGGAASMDNGAQPHTLVQWPARLPHYPAGQLLLGGCVALVCVACACLRG